MTMTDSPPVSDVDAAVGDDDRSDSTSGLAADVSALAPDGLVGAIVTNDHKTVGRFYIGFSLLFAVGIAVVGVLTRIEQLDAGAPDHIFGGLNAFFQMWTLYRVGFTLLVLMPLLLGIAMVVVPLQIGATNIAFPRAALASFWSWLIGAVVIIASVFAGGGWGALDGVTADESDAMALTLLGTGMVVVSLLLGAVCVATTVISLRTSGMNLLRVPLFSWSMLVTATVWLLTLPVVIANLAIIYADLRGRTPIAFGQPESADIWRQLDWMVEQPAVFAMAIPILGIIGDVVPVAVRVRQAQHAVLVTAIALFGLFAIGGWSQDFFTTATATPVDHRTEVLYVAFGIAIVLPVLIVFGGIADTLRRGLRNLSGAPSAILLGAIAALVLVEGAAIAGLLRVIEPFELLERATTTGIFNAVIVAGLAGSVTALWYWSSKIFGRPIPEGPGRAAVFALLIGGVALAASDVVGGFFLADDFQSGPHAESVVDALNVIALIGMVIVALSLLMVVASVWLALRPGGPAAGDDPWDGHTLEWATASPPAWGNFDRPPAPVMSERPLLDLAERELAGSEVPAPAGEEA